MHVALVSEHANPLAALGGVDAGGQNVYVRCLAAGLAARGHRVTVFTRRDDPRSADVVLLRDGVRVVHLTAGPATHVDKDCLFPFMDEFAHRLTLAMRGRGVDLLHSHFWMSGYAARHAAGTLGLPLVHTFHALGTVKRRHQPDADRSPAERLGEERRLARDADLVVATCRDEVAELRRMDATSPIAVVPCGFDGTTFRQFGAALPRTARLRVSAVSRPVPRKGLADVVAAMVAVGDAELVVAGGSTGDEPHHDELRALAESLGIADRVRFLGGVDPATVAALHRSSDLFVHAPWYEPFGIAPVEAMGCGLAVLGTAVGGLLDTVVEDVTGVLVPPRDPDALAAAMAALLASPERRARLGRRAGIRAHGAYTWPHVATTMEAEYRQVLGVGVQSVGLRA